jgi:hypothetical protein
MSSSEIKSCLHEEVRIIWDQYEDSENYDYIIGLVAGFIENKLQKSFNKKSFGQKLI